MLQKDGGGRDGIHVGPRTGTIGDVDGIGKTAKRESLLQQIVTVAGDRRSNFGGENEFAGFQRIFEMHEVIGCHQNHTVREEYAESGGTGLNQGPASSRDGTP